jgi:hypothetical protein
VDKFTVLGGRIAFPEFRDRLSLGLSTDAWLVKGWFVGG